MIWREKRLLLIVLGLLLAANAIFFLTYRVQYENRLRALDVRLEQKKAQLEEARRARVTSEQQIAAYRKVQSDVRQIYDAEWSTENQRLTAFIGEVMKLAAQAGSRTLSFQKNVAAKGARPSSAAATEVGISFAVEGTYEQVRRLINLLELSNQFVIIDQISLSSERGDKLNMTIHVKTLFRDSTTASLRKSNQEL
jgi:hypothetical protein